MTEILDTRAGRVFHWVTGRPRRIILFSVVIIALCAVGLPRLGRDSSAEAFIPPDAPAVLYRNKVEEIFGLSDPVVMLVINEGPHGIFNPESLRLVAWLTEKVESLHSVNDRRVTSLATENDIIGTDDGFEVTAFFDEPPRTQADADRIREAVMDFRLYVGNLVSPSGDATLIAAELRDKDESGAAYEQVLDLVDAAHEAGVVTEGNTVHVAGEGAVSAHLGVYIDADMKRLNILCGIVISTVLFFSYRTARGIMLPWIVVGGAVAITMGLMGTTGHPFYVITNALPVILIAIGVADGVHIIGRYYEETAQHPDRPTRELVVVTMVDMWRPVTVTSLTDMAGFMGLFIASAMPPMKAFGMFAAIGAGSAMLMSLTVLPSILVLMRPGRSRAFPDAPKTAELAVDGFGRFMAGLGRVVTRRAGTIIAASAAVIIAGLFGASRLEVNDERIRNFREREPIFQANAAINDKLNGVNFLDIVIETDREFGLFEPATLEKCEALQDHLLALEHVKGAVSFLDYTKQMNRALNSDRPDEYVVPKNEALVAQYFELYHASGAPDDFEHLMDPGSETANIRLAMGTGLYTNEKQVVEEAERFIDERFPQDGPVRANLAGRVNVDYHWIRRLADSHFQSVFVALVAVWLMLAISFRSTVAGLLALAPVVMSVLLIYAVMGFAGIWLSIGTSMFAAIAIGTGVDFAVHSLDRLIALIRHEGRTLEEAFEMMFPSTGRALVFNFSAVLLGFGLLATSHVPPLIRFGVLTTVSIAVSFLASLTMLPALIKVFRPRFIGIPRDGAAGPAPAPVAVLVAAVLLPLGAAATAGAESITGDEIARRVNARDDGDHVSRDLTMKMIDKRGRQRVRVTSAFRKYEQDVKKTAIFYHKPKNLKDQAFLNHDYHEVGRDDDRWIYLPAMRKVRRISASERGDYFFGTDMTYEDINNETKVNIEDYTRTYQRDEPVDGHACHVMEALPVDRKTAKQLGYGRVVSWVDPKIWMLRKAEYYDVKGRLLKTIGFRDIRQVQGRWTAHRLEAKNHQTKHQTLLLFENVDYEKPLPDDLFTLRRLRRGL